jgi:hypothetical protein
LICGVYREEESKEGEKLIRGKWKWGIGMTKRLGSIMNCLFGMMVSELYGFENNLLIEGLAKHVIEQY